MRRLIIRLCQWIINKLTPTDEWKSIIPTSSDGIVRYITESGQVWYKDGEKWSRMFLGLMISLYIVGCSTHKHCGTAHYSEMTSQDFENMKRRTEVNEFLLRR